MDYLFLKTKARTIPTINMKNATGIDSNKDAPAFPRPSMNAPKPPKSAIGIQTIPIIMIIIPNTKRKVFTEAI